MIGLFDSGVGGLAALSVLRAGAPRADILYFADEANLPWGEKNAPALIELTRAAIARLLAEGASAILSACGTASSVALPVLQKECPVPLYGILTPTAEAAARAWRGGSILILGTRATVESGALSTKIHALAPHAPLFSLPCPDFVPLAEAFSDVGGIELRRRVRRTLAPALFSDFSVVVLGCTHFSRLGAAIGELFPHASLIDGAAEAARAMLAALPKKALLGAGRTIFRTSGGLPIVQR